MVSAMNAITATIRAGDVVDQIPHVITTSKARIVAVARAATRPTRAGKGGKRPMANETGGTRYYVCW